MTATFELGSLRLADAASWMTEVSCGWPHLPMVDGPTVWLSYAVGGEGELHRSETYPRQVSYPDRLGG
jgi:hypothetical protein